MSSRAFRHNGPDWLRTTFGASWLLWTGVAVLILAITGWTVAIFRFDDVPFALLDPTAYGAVEAARSLALMFGALALVLFPDTGARDRMRWVAFGLIVLATGGIVFSYVFTSFADMYSANERLYASIVVRTVAAALMVIGLVPTRCPQLTAWRILLVISVTTLLAGVVLFVEDLRPSLTDVSLMELLQAPQSTVLAGLTIWHWLVSAVPFTLIVLIVLRLLWSSPEGRVRNWLIIAMVLFAGSHLHNMIWPSIYSPVATTADILRIGFAAIILFGVFLELRDVAAERAMHLTEEREYARRLEELQLLRADFTRMVAHELSNPLAAIQRYTEVLNSDQIDGKQRQQMVLGIQQEAGLLRNLIADVHSAALVERDEFHISPSEIPVQLIITDAIEYAQTIPELNVIGQAGESVHISADRERIGQVMRNLLTNAAKYSPPGTPVEVTSTLNGDRVRISVKDHGPGIHPEDQGRIFAKFGRGRTLEETSPPGLGLGLYVSRRLLRLHGSELQVTSETGKGAEFSFELVITR